MLIFILIVFGLVFIIPLLPVWNIIWRINGDNKWYRVKKSFGFLWTEPHIMYVLEHSGNVQYGRAIIGINVPLLHGASKYNPSAFRNEEQYTGKDFLSGTMFNKK